MSEIAEKTEFTFDELDEDAKTKAIEDHRDWNVDGSNTWWEYVYEDAKQCGKCLGIKVADISFSGFWSQGDGCWIDATYTHRTDCIEAIKQHASEDKELHGIAERLCTFQTTMKLTHGTLAWARMTVSRNHWQNIIAGAADEEVAIDHFADEVERPLDRILEDFPAWIYKQLEAEYEYLTSDEAISEILSESTLRFDELGNTL